VIDYKNQAKLKPFPNSSNHV